METVPQSSGLGSERVFGVGVLGTSKEKTLIS